MASQGLLPERQKGSGPASRQREAELLPVQLGELQDRWSQSKPSPSTEPHEAHGDFPSHTSERWEKTGCTGKRTGQRALGGSEQGRLTPTEVEEGDVLCHMWAVTPRGSGEGLSVPCGGRMEARASLLSTTELDLSPARDCTPRS